MMTKRVNTFVILVLTVMVLLVMSAEAADGDFEWAKQMGGVSDDYGSSIAIDSMGNVYTTGNFQGTVDFDPGAGTFNLTATGDRDIFVSKLDSNGNFLWAIQMGGTGSDLSMSSAIAVDDLGNVYTTGRFWGTVDFDPGVGEYMLASAGDYNIFVSKIDSTGGFIWAGAMGGTSYDYGYGIAVDSTGNIYATGSFEGTVDFDPGAGTTNLISAGNDDIFVSKLDSTGNFVWAINMGSVEDDRGNSIAVDSMGNIYITGEFQGTTDFDPGPGTFNLTSWGYEDIFVLKINSAGNFVWAGRMGEANSDSGAGIAVDDSGNIYTTGDFRGTLDFDLGAGTFLLTSVGAYDVFVSKFNSAGGFLWAMQIAGTSWEFSDGIAVDDLGNVYTTGHFQGMVDFDPGAGTFNLTSAGDMDVFVSKFDNAGAFVWAKSIGGVEGDYSTSIAVNDLSNVYATGYFNDTVDFDPGTETFNITSAGGFDAFVLKLSAPPDTTPPEINISAPSVSHTSPGGSVDYTVSYTGESVASLSPADITLDTTGDVTATVSIWPTKDIDYTVTLSDITGTGTLGFTIAAGTAMDEAGNLAAEASTPILVTVGPPMPVAAWPVALVLLTAGTAMIRKRCAKK